MSSKNSNLIQTRNPRTGRWIVVDTAKRRIVKNSPTKVKGIKVKGKS